MKKGRRMLIIRRMALTVLSVFVCDAVFARGNATPSEATAARVNVPFVGCKSDGQVGPLAAPKGKSKPFPISVAAAEKLAYYQAQEGGGVLAPQGWHCFGTYGSNGSNLYVSPEPLNSKVVFGSNWKGFVGPVVQLSDSIGDTSGRFEVAAVIARVFPAHRAFLESVVNEKIEPWTSFPEGPYPKDKLTYKSKETVEFETPAKTDGLGTNSRLVKNGSAIDGVAMLVGEEQSLVFLAVRLPLQLKALTPVIVNQAERD